MLPFCSDDARHLIRDRLQCSTSFLWTCVEKLYQSVFALLFLFAAVNIAWAQSNELSSLNLRGRFHLRNQDYEEAIRFLAEAKNISEEEFGSEHLVTGFIVKDIGEANLGMGDIGAAEKNIMQAHSIIVATSGHGTLEAASTLISMSRLRHAQGNYPAAMLHVLESIDIRERKLWPNHPDLAAAINDLAILQAELGLPVFAEASLRRVLEISRAAFGPNDRHVGLALSNLAFLLEQNGEETEADQLFKQAIEIQIKKLPSSHPQLLRSLGGYFDFLSQTGRSEEAEKIRKEIEAGREIDF